MTSSSGLRSWAAHLIAKHNGDTSGFYSHLQQGMVSWVAAPLKFGNAQVMPSHILPDMWLQVLYRQSRYSNPWDSKCLALIAQVVRAFGMNPKIESSSLPHFGTFSITKISTLSQEHLYVTTKMSDVARAQLSFQVLTLLQKYLYRLSQYSHTWDSKCLALLAQVVRTFGMNPKVKGSSPPQAETFSVSKTSTLWQEFPFVRRNWMPRICYQTKHLPYLMMSWFYSLPGHQGAQYCVSKNKHAVVSIRSRS